MCTPNARSIPLDLLDARAVMSQRSGSADQPLFVTCRSGNRSSQACGKFAQAGYENVVNVDGGMLAWENSGLPVVRGVVLGYFVHPYFVGLSGFVGAGLMFAGCTGLCPMASFITKMPWNQCGDGVSCSA